MVSKSTLKSLVAGLEILPDADPSFAKQVLGWNAVKSLDDMCADAWRWQQMNPSGYRKG